MLRAVLDTLQDSINAGNYKTSARRKNYSHDLDTTNVIIDYIQDVITDGTLPVRFWQVDPARSGVPEWLRLVWIRNVEAYIRECYFRGGSPINSGKIIKETIHYWVREYTQCGLYHEISGTIEDVEFYSWYPKKNVTCCDKNVMLRVQNMLRGHLKIPVIYYTVGNRIIAFKPLPMPEPRYKKVKKDNLSI